MPKVTLDDFARSFGATADDIRAKCSDILDKYNFAYSVLDGAWRDALIMKILKQIDNDQQVIGSPERHHVWNNGWGENLSEFVNSGHDLRKLVPKFIRNGQPVRFNLQYIQPASPTFELDYFTIFRHWLFKTYFHDISHIYEFGCGTGFNLVALAQLYPQKKLYGLDFAPSAVELLTKIKEHHGFNLCGRLFDMIVPDSTFKLEKGSAVLTIGAIEQLASKFAAFLEYLLEQPSSLYIHIEPAIELYDTDNLVDFLAAKFQAKRGYTQNLLPYLKEYENAGKIKLLKVKRLYFGSLFMEGYNCIVWCTTTQHA